MLNPLFWIVLMVTLLFSFYSLSNWKLGLLVFFVYMQFFGIVKRIILFIGLDNLAYNLLVGLQYVFLLSIILGVIRDPEKRKLTSYQVYIWLAAFTLMLAGSMFISPYGMGISISLAILQFLPLFIIIVGQYLEDRQVDDLKTLFIKTAPIHALYQIYQFFFGPFNFELSFVDSKSSITNFAEGDFVRGIPLYDSVDPLYLHFALAFFLLMKQKKTLYSILNMLLILLALVMIGNRSGMVILFIGLTVLLILEWKSRFKKLILSSLILVVITTLSIFGFLLMDVITSLESINLSQSDFGTRWGSLGTYSDRIIGRQKASENTTFFGKGIGSSGLAATTLANKGMNFEAADTDLFAHDLVGEILLDFGIIGLIIFGFLLWRLLNHSIKDYANTPFLAMIVGSFLGSSLLGGSFTYGRAGYFVFLFAGFLLNKRLALSAKYPQHV